MEKQKLKFDLSKCREVQIENIGIGDVFFEDTYPEVYKITGNHIDPGWSQEMTDVEMIGYLDGFEGDPAKIGETDSFAMISVLWIRREKQNE